MEGQKGGSGALWAALGRFYAAPAAGSALVVVFGRVLGVEDLADEEPVGGGFGLGWEVLHLLPENGGTGAEHQADVPGLGA